MSESAVFTYQTRLALDELQERYLEEYAALYGRAQRSLFAKMQAGQDLNTLKRSFIRDFGITARQFNALRVELQGKIEAVRKRRPGLLKELKHRICKAESVIRKLETKAPGTNKLHQKKRRLAILKARYAAMQADEASGKVRLCFGSKRLFRAQFHLQANGYENHEAWLSDWRRSRSNHFFVMGSGDETAGNQSCKAQVENDGTITLHLRLPNALANSQKTLVIRGLHFAYGHESIVSALQNSRRVSCSTQTGRITTKRIGSAISYRFVRDNKGWRVFASVEVPAPRKVTSRLGGAIGIDINPDHLAVTEGDRHGNFVGTERIDLPLRGKSKHQALALIANAAATVAKQAKAAGKPVAIERLDLKKRKAELESVTPDQARTISAFAYTKIIHHLKSACFRAGVEVIEVNPAYTSVIGAVRFAKPYGISIHQGAALAIARRGLGFSERLPRRTVVVPVRNCGHVALTLPVRNRERHVWSQWAEVGRRLKAAHAAHVRLRHRLTPLPPETPAMSAHRGSTVKLRGANRFQRCSGSVVGDVLQ